MVKRVGSLLIAAILIFGSVGVTATARTHTSALREGTDEASVLFDPLKVITVKITRTLGGPALSKRYLSYSGYRKANIQIQLSGTSHYTTIMNVGVRQKGSYTRRFDKPSLKIKFDEFVKGQSFMGLKRLTLNAMMQDKSLVHEVTAYKLYRSVGVPAPRAGYAEVTVDQRLQGLYLNLESVDTDMLKRWYTSSKHLYSGVRFCDLVPDQHCYVDSIGNNIQLDLLKATNIAKLHGKAWWKAFKKRADSEEVIKLMATDIFLSNWDGYTDFSRNNHYVHFDKKGRFTIIPWGTDQTFPTSGKFQLNWDGSKSKGFHDLMERSTLWDHCLEYAPCHNELLHQGFLVAQTAEAIDLVGYKNAIAAKVTRSKYIKNDISGLTIPNAIFYQNYIDSFLKLRESSIRNFLLVRSPIPLTAAVPTSAKVNDTITAQVEQSWEPGVSEEFQWFQNNQPIKNATSANYRATKVDRKQILKLRITLKKASTKETVYFTKTVQVS
jgi:hypothetical protein